MLASGFVWAGTPPLPCTGACDPDAAIFGDRVFVFCTNDRGGQKNWSVWSTDNFVSKDGKNYQKVTEGNWKNDFTLKQVEFPPQEARFVRLEILETASSDAQPGRKGNVAIAEMYVIATKH